MPKSLPLSHRIGRNRHVLALRQERVLTLVETEAKVSSVALDSGFASLSAFYEAFTKEHKQSPAEYRRQSQRSNPFLAFHAQP
ncbi:helix-turn-helix domain-containing protein [Fluviibacterium sp. S390]|uniref:helix-turn-helix domain-containing protein n=1 Tax=Fluviibacterium sp. S390 TaxID=3415139 RepID=UPI003C7A7D8B